MSSGAVRQQRRALRQIGGRHEGTRDSAHIGEVALAAPGTLYDGTDNFIVGVSAIGTGNIAPAAEFVIGQSAIGSGDYIAAEPVDTTIIIGEYAIGRGLKRIG